MSAYQNLNIPKTNVASAYRERKMTFGNDDVQI